MTTNLLNVIFTVTHTKFITELMAQKTTDQSNKKYWKPVKFSNTL